MQISPVDEMLGANPEVARAVVDMIPGPKTIMEIDGGHFGLLHYPSEWFDAASTAQRDFLNDALR